MCCLCFQADISCDGLAQHVLAQQAPKPLTEAEKELAVIKQNEVKH
jgi:hypothetical protein